MRYVMTCDKVHIPSLVSFRHMGTKFTTQQLSTIIIFSALAAITSVPIGHISNYMKTIPLLPLGTGQILAGFHLIMIVLTALYVKQSGAATLTGAVKGFAEAVLFSFHGLPVIFMSVFQGAIIDVVLYIIGYGSKSMILGCGLSAASNVMFIQFFLGNPFPVSAFVLMYILSFISGAVFGGYLGERIYQIVSVRLPKRT